MQVNSGADDVNEDGTSYVANYGALWIGTGANPSASFTGLRFNNVRIPVGATVTSARLEFYTGQQQWIPVNIEVAGDATANSTPFSSANRPSQRPLTNMRRVYTINESWSPNVPYSITELQGIIQVIINQPGWQSGNSLSLILRGNSPGTWSRKFVYSFEGNVNFAVRLVINYTT